MLPLTFFLTDLLIAGTVPGAFLTRREMPVHRHVAVDRKDQIARVVCSEACHSQL
jgi:hypothetical protein